MTPEPRGPNGASAVDFALAGARMIEAAADSVVQVSGGGRGRGGRSGWGAGAGFVWGDEGLVMTNHHVVAGAARRGRSRALAVALRDGRSFDAEVVRHSRNLDLTLLRLTGDTGSLPALRLGDSDALRVGSLVYAIGHPWGRSGTVTSGIVSAIGATRWPGGRRANLVQSDVSLAPGNSGGPLLDAKGEVVGVNAMISGSLALSVPSNAAALWVSEVGEPRPDRARLGVGILPAGVPGVGREGGAGVVVAAVEEGSPAARAGMMVGDVLVEASGEPVAGPDTLLRAVGRASAKITLGVSRGGRLFSVDVYLGAPGQAA